MKLSEITLDNTKEFLRVTHNLDDSRIEGHIDTAISFILKANGQDALTTDFDDSNTFLSDVAFAMIQKMYDTGEIPDARYLYAMLTMDRSF